jgi:hypothetical protein
MKSDRGKRRGRTWAIWAGVFLAVLLLSRPSQAAIKYWVDATDWWDVSANWSPAGQPQNGDSVYLTQSDATNRTVYYRNTAYPSAVLYVLRINATGSGTMTLIQGYGGYADPLASSYEYVGFSGGTGTHLQRAGSNTISNDLWLGVQTGSTGNYELSGNSSLSATTQVIGYGGNGTFTQTGGSNTISYYSNVAGSGTLYLGHDSGSSGAYNLSGNSSLSATTQVIGYNGTGTFTQTGGTNTVANSLTIAANVGSSGTYFLQGGTLNADTITVNPGGAFYQTGGTLKGASGK